MIISEEQLERVREYVRSGCNEGDECASGSPEISAELAARIRSIMDSAPEIRPERLERARADMAQGALTSQDVAAKIVARAVSDSLR